MSGHQPKDERNGDPQTASPHKQPPAPEESSPMNSSAGASPPSGRQSTSQDHEGSSGRQMHQRYVFSDPVAFRYLEEDPSTMVLDRRQRLEGYELYLVEQWACSRVHPTFVITTFTGDPSHSVLVSVLSVPTDEEAWSPRLKVYFKAVSQLHGRLRETPLGMLMVTNLSYFPSALTVIPVPNGDVKSHREDFIVNEDLKRLGCSGRAGLNLAMSTGATQAKFHQLYRTSNRIPLYSAVIELVQLCQVALMLFGKLGLEYADGLLCDVTERAINDWWTELGTDFYDLEPSDGILGPTTVAALLGMLMGARNRLNTYGAPVGKDAFDIGSMKRGIAYFQKSQKLLRTRRLDRPTHGRLCKVTSKAANSDGWTVPKAVKSTVAELSGKGGEMVLGMVGARDKPGIGEIETVDIERFVQLVSGERSKWLWYGKPRKSLATGTFPTSTGDESLVFGKDNQGGYAWTGRKRTSFDFDSGGTGTKRRDEESGVPSDIMSPDSAAPNDLVGERDQNLGRTVLKSVTGKMTDARSGFERIKDAVGIPGLRSHHHKHSKEDGAGLDMNGSLSIYQNRNHSETALASLKSPQSATPLAGQKSDPDVLIKPIQAKMDDLRREREAEMQSAAVPKANSHAHLRSTSVTSLPLVKSATASPDMPLVKDESEGNESPGTGNEATGTPRSPVLKPGSTRENRYRIYHEFNDLFPEDPRDASRNSALLRRSQSHSRFSERRNDRWWPRSMSFSDAMEAVLVRNDLAPASSDAAGPTTKLSEAMKMEESVERQAKLLYEGLVDLEGRVCTWVERELQGVESLDLQASRDQEELNAVYYQRFDEYQATSARSTALLGAERTHLSEAVREVEMLGAKLEYELNALVLKVEDAEDGVADFERQVLDLEEKARLLEAGEKAPETWMKWGMRIITGIGPSAASRSL